MKKKITAITAVTLFLVQAILLAGTAPAESYSLNPPTGVSMDKCVIFTMALGRYRQDIQGLPAVKPAASSVCSDFESVHFLNKGCTRYYSFSVGKETFLMRACRTDEVALQPKITFIEQFVSDEFGVTLQILPGINDLLSDHKIKPIKVASPSPADRHA